MRFLLETRWFTLNLTTPEPTTDGPPSQGLEASGQGSYELAYDDSIGFRAPLHNHPEE